MKNITMFQAFLNSLFYMCLAIPIFGMIIYMAKNVILDSSEWVPLIAFFLIITFIYAAYIKANHQDKVLKNEEILKDFIKKVIQEEKKK